MSSEGSVTSTASRIRQFGLYRTIDARTDEFLRSSRRRQIRQGCACAAISTAITVTVVVVILIIYEYAIAVEWSLVRNKEGVAITPKFKNQPIADRLDRSYFGFDQEYFQQMPLLINALQESNYIDPTLEISGILNNRNEFNSTVLKTTENPILITNVRKTSPRPFYFKYRHPNPSPFSKTYGSRTWVEKLRNEERLKNIRQIIKYLENTVHAKVGDMHAKPTEKHVAINGFNTKYNLVNKSESFNKPDLQTASSNNVKRIQINHIVDPLFNFKPENPGDVNRLADDFVRFSPVGRSKTGKKGNEYPMIRPISFLKRNCRGDTCEHYDEGNIKLFESSPTTKPLRSISKPFTVMLNLHSMTEKEGIFTTKQSIDKIYFTTARPLIQFKRKPNISSGRFYTPYKRPRYLSNLIKKDLKLNKTKEIKLNNVTNAGTQIQVKIKNQTREIHSTNFSSFVHTNPYTTKAPIEFSTSEIEDYHAGSSGYIPISVQTDKSLPKVKTIFNFFDTTTEHWNAPTVQSSSVIKFNYEDAKVPKHYSDIKKDIRRRNTMGIASYGELLEEIHSHENMTQKVNVTKVTGANVEPSTLVVKLKNDFSYNVTSVTEANTEEITTSIRTYVPQINGHYRSINQNSRNVNKWLNADTESDRKRHLEDLASDFRPHLPMYVEIKRNNSKIPHTEDNITITKNPISRDTH